MRPFKYKMCLKLVQQSKIYTYAGAKNNKSTKRFKLPDGPTKN